MSAVEGAAGVLISAVEAVPVAVSGAREFRISEGGTRRHISVVLRLLSDQPGLEGNAEIVCAPPGKPELLPGEILEAVREAVAPALIGADAARRRPAAARVEAALKERAWIKAAVDVALYDLHAKTLGVSVAELLGGRFCDRVPVIGPVIGMARPAAMAERAAAIAGSGYRTLKLKVGDKVAADIARVAAVREAVGPEIALRVDANDHYPPSEAIRLIRAIEPYDIEHVEQPVPRRDLLGMAEVRRAVGVPLMTDDMIATPQEAMTVVRLGAADRVKVKVSKHGLDGARLIVGMMASAGVRCVLGHVFELGLAGVAEAQFAVSTGGVSTGGLLLPCEIGSMRPLGCETDIIRETLEPEPGTIRVPDGPGLGVSLDWEAIRTLSPSD